MRDRREMLEFLAATALLGCGLVAFAFGWDGVAQGLWTAAAVLGVVISTVSMWAAVRRRQPSVDIIALLALAGALAVGEPFAGAMVAVMLTTGMLLEARAATRARRELSLLVARTPRTSRLLVGDALVDVDVGEVVRGDRLLVGTGEVVPVDGRLVSSAVLDESALTGEPLPIERPAGDDVRSGRCQCGRLLLSSSPLPQPRSRPTRESCAGGAGAGRRRLRSFASPIGSPIYFVPFTLLLAGARVAGQR